MNSIKIIGDFQNLISVQFIYEIVLIIQVKLLFVESCNIMKDSSQKGNSCMKGFNYKNGYMDSVEKLFRGSSNGRRSQRII